MPRSRVGRVSSVVLAVALVSASAGWAQAPAATLAPASASAAAAPDSARAALARRLLELMDVGPTIIRELEASGAAQRQSSPGVPEVFWTEFLSRARRDVGQFVETLVPVYASRFTRDELAQLVAFYESPVGRRLTAETEPLGAAVKQEAYRWGVNLGADVAKDLAARGIMLQ